MKGLDGEIKKKETILKGHRIDLKRRSELAKEISKIKSENRANRIKNPIVSLNKIFKKSKQRLLDIKRTKSLEKKERLFPAEKYGLLFVVRNFREVESNVSRDALQELGLLTMNTGRFFSNSVENLKLLDKVLPFIYYGKPSLKHVTDILHKRGTVYAQGNKTNLISSNVVVEDNFGKFGLYSIGELIDAIYNGSEGHDDMLRILGPIKLSKSDRLEQFVFHPIYPYKTFTHLHANI
ncbi:60S ribosomal protein L7, putative [Theileria equi strain WA]|uniref:60S ribosomal protein L7, putative n=1 Tax=Theileria equi strain WA TaxID=1537102 RepID=L0AYQ2_THEEQ|nr:60S ribosomal protein L7, putative [Theileria equi strain WA]AFZ80722.1 60S ribosomal protein L7, putative [Theileria equi strain WA]|eukprot:XP_004830388.1 60S ribosomal protein L7, putative [Theileria equi strain WA]